MKTKRNQWHCLLLYAGLFLSFFPVDEATAQNRQIIEEKERTRAYSAYIGGLAAFENEDYQQALELLNTAYVKGLASHAGVNFALADAYFHLSDYENAEYYGTQAVKLEPQNRWYHLKLFEIYREAGKETLAIKELTTTLQYHPEDTDLLFELAQTYSDFGELHLANKTLNKLLHLQGEDINIRLQRLENFHNLNATDSMAAELQQIRKISPDDLPTLRVIGNYYLQIDRIREAKEVLNHAREINEHDPETLVMLSEIYLTENKWDSLATTLGGMATDSAVSDDDKLELARSIYLQFSEDTTNTGFRRAAGTIFKKMMEAEPNSARLQAISADFFIQTHQNELALQALERATELTPTNDTAWKQRLQLLLNVDKVDEALVVGQQAAEEIPQDPAVLYYLGVARLARHDFENALTNLQEANNLPVRRPLKVNILNALGEAYAGLKNWDMVFENYEQSLKIEPDNATTLNSYASLLAQQANYLDKAQQIAKQAVTLDPKNPNFLDTLGWIYFQMEAFQKAQKYFQMALNTGKAGAEVMEHMGDVMHKLQEPQAAKTWWRKALEKDSTRIHLKAKIST